MKCQLCKATEATIHLTQVVDGVVKKIHICEACAAEKGFDVHGPMSITDFLLGLGEETPVVPKPSIKMKDRSCPRCHLRRIDFKKTGRLGCPDCYETFVDELEPLLRAMHRHEQHQGKIPEKARSHVESTKEMESLKQSLTHAIDEENYEEAARVRDAIQELRKRASAKDRTNEYES